jgi:hypothetical protein
MTQFKTLLVLIFVLFANTISAQIEKGNYSLGGDFGLSIGRQKSDFSQTTYTNAMLNPSINKFITNKWLAELTPNLISSSIKSAPDLANGQSGFNSKYNVVGLKIGSRYYFANTNKVFFFGYANASLTKGWSSYNYVNDTIYSYKTNAIRYEIGVGADIFLNSEIALEPTFSYDKTPINQNGNKNLDNSESYSFKLNFNNFINLSPKRDEKEAPQYLKKGRQILGGNIYVNNFKYSVTQPRVTQISINPKFGYFFTEKTLISTEIAWDCVLYQSKGSNNTQYLSGSVSARYFFRLNNRFSIYPEFEGRYWLNVNELPRVSDVINLKFGIGGTYFLTKNVALDARFLEYNA